MKRKTPEKDYTHESLRKEREYGLFWYSWLWHLLRPILLALCVIVVVTGVVMTTVNWVDRNFFAPVDAQDQSYVTFEVASGNSLTRVANNLESQGLIRNRTVFKYYADFLGYGQKIQAGEYQVSKSMRMQEIMELLTTGDGNPITRNITIIPGWTIRDIADYLKAQGVIEDTEAFLAPCRTGQDYAAYYYIADVLKTNDVGSRLYALEGYLAPDTYEIYTNATVADIIKKLLSQTEAVFKSEYHDRAAELGMTMDEVITLASMIEKEAKTNDFAKVSAVFHNRLKSNMTLGSDVTIKYISGVKRMSLTNEDLQINSPYNTYQYKGLPPGPICSPSAGAIYAALYPDEQFIADQYLYFCSKDPDTGELHFSRTLEEHNIAVSIYAPLWQAYDKEQGL
ncbi:MAG: endolytic transglycosylase MltG [Clostridiales bacterium]|nr:endolytic transglycosylase MltG [Clostridiales bacterium]